MRFLVSLLGLFSASMIAQAGKLPEPYSYSQPVPGGQFLFVMLGDPAEEAKTPTETQTQFRELRAKYARTGLYRQDTAELVWALEDAGFAPYDNVFPAPDGVHFVRLDGDWWRTYRYPANKRLPDDVEARQLAAPAVSFYRSGQLIRTYRVDELITTPADLLHTPEHVLWKSDASMHTETGRFIVFTHDSNRVVFDYYTGELITRSKAGLGNPLMRGILAVTAVMMVAVLGTWAWFAFRRRQPVIAGTNPAIN